MLVPSLTEDERMFNKEEKAAEKEDVKRRRTRTRTRTRKNKKKRLFVKWANHYSSVQDILLVGEGDFSFSLCLANAFGSASNIVATSLDSYDTLLKKYSKAKSNLERLKEMGATILHKMDATKMKFHADLKMRKFDRIVFNFPHAGFKWKENNMRMINSHKQLVNGFFQNASHMVRPYGEVHVSHKIGGPFDRWDLEKLASNNSLDLIMRANFGIDEYPGYSNKRGDGDRSDHTFPLGECKTFQFKIKGRKKEAIPYVGANNISSNNPWVRTSNSLYYPLRSGIHNVQLVRPNIENLLRIRYHTCMNETIPKDVLFDYWKHQEDIWNQSNAEYCKVVLLNYGRDGTLRFGQSY